jgi:hypothetical protein
VGLGSSAALSRVEGDCAIWLAWSGDAPGANAGIRYHQKVTTLVPSGRSDDRDLHALGARARELEAEFAERSAGLARLDQELTAFKIRYRHEVGRLHEQLDELELAIAEVELGEITKKLDQEGADATSAPTGAKTNATPRLTSDAVRRLFRDVAKVIHPDLAHDSHARDRRHKLMVAANHAYAAGDEQRLRAILEAWERSPEAVLGDDLDAARQRLIRRIAQMEEELETCARDLVELQESPICKLKALVDDAASRGKDLVGDMVKRLKRDILAAQNRLDAMRS